MAVAKFKPGDEVRYVNDYGVDWGKRTITKVYDGDPFPNGKPRYFIEPTDCPWYPVEEGNLSLMTPKYVGNPKYGAY